MLTSRVLLLGAGLGWLHAAPEKRFALLPSNKLSGVPGHARLAHDSGDGGWGSGGSGHATDLLR